MTDRGQVEQTIREALIRCHQDNQAITTMLPSREAEARYVYDAVVTLCGELTPLASTEPFTCSICRDTEHVDVGSYYDPVSIPCPVCTNL